jgi:hypothetical protein
MIAAVVFGASAGFKGAAGIILKPLLMRKALRG